MNGAGAFKRGGLSVTLTAHQNRRNGGTSGNVTHGDDKPEPLEAAWVALAEAADWLEGKVPPLD